MYSLAFPSYLPFNLHSFLLQACLFNFLCPVSYFLYPCGSSFQSENLRYEAGFRADPEAPRNYVDIVSKNV
jgi:hypothetical protein